MSKKMQAKKPLTRTLGTEPLEERLPISGSAAGVLFGFGLTQNEPGVKRSATPGYEASQIISSSLSAQQPTLIDLTLDLQLDALAVDLVHAEESLLDTISPASPDPFVLTPLAPGIDLGDTTTDAHRELGDELLLFQISTPAVYQVSFEPMTPQRESLQESWRESLLDEIDDPLIPPGDLTKYGYNALANDLKDGGHLKGGGAQMSSSCGCDDGCGCDQGCSCGCGGGSCCAPYVTSGCFIGSNAGWYSNGQGSYNYYPNQTIYFIQNGNSVTVNPDMFWNGDGVGTIEITTPGTAKYWSNTLVISGNYCNTFSWNFTWTLPAGVSNEKALRDFEFTFSVSGGNSVSMFVHVGWAEVLIQFAGQGGFAPKTTSGGQTEENTVVVGQKVHAIVDYDPEFNVGWQWSTPIGGDIVNNYETDDTIGVVTPFAPADELEFYYVTNHTHCGYGDLGATITAVDPNGVTHTIYDTQSYFLEAPTATSFSSVFASWNPAENAVGVRPFVVNPNVPPPPDELILGGTPKGKGVSPGITWTATVNPPPVIPGNVYLWPVL